MKKFAPFMLSAAAAILLGGCDAFFDMNLFKPFETIGLIPPSSEIKKMDAGEIETLAGSDAFYEELAKDDGAKDDFVDRLRDIENDPDSSDTEIQTAALIEGNIHLRTTQAGDAVNNLANFLADGDLNADYSTFTPEDAAAFVKAIVPSGVLDDKDAFTEMIQAFEAAYTPLMLYGSLIDDPSKPPAVDSANPGEIAMTPSCCALVMAIVPEPPLSRADSLWLLMDDNASNDPADTFDQGTIDANPSLDNILDQAGLAGLIQPE